MSGRSQMLVLGGARSGKSRYAQMQAEAGVGELVYIATAQALDAEMAERIARHRADRGDRWRTVEAPVELVQTLRAEAAPGRTLVVDCLTLWLSNLMLSGEAVEGRAQELVDSLPTLPGRLFLISNEVGLGIVPETPLGRRFRDHAGHLHQAIAGAVDQVVLMVAGLPLSVKANRTAAG